jgi:hypothetical protein
MRRPSTGFLGAASLYSRSFPPCVRRRPPQGLGHLLEVGQPRFLDAAGLTAITDHSKRIKSLTAALRGEAQRPTGIVVESNGPGAHDIGRAVLKELNDR